MTLALPTEENSPLPYSGQDPRERRDLIIATSFTLLYFFLFAFFWFSSDAISRLTKKEGAAPVRTNLKIQRLAQAPSVAPPPMASQFVDASGLKETDKVDPRTALQSDRNTAASSKVVNGTDPTLGGQEGKKNDSLTMQNSQFSPNQASPPPPPASAPPQPSPLHEPNPTPPHPSPKPNSSNRPQAQAKPPKNLPRKLLPIPPPTKIKAKTLPLHPKLKPLPRLPTPHRPWLLRQTFSAIAAPFRVVPKWAKMPPSHPWAQPLDATNISSTLVSAHAGI